MILKHLTVTNLLRSKSFKVKVKVLFLRSCELKKAVGAETGLVKSKMNSVKIFFDCVNLFLKIQYDHTTCMKASVQFIP